MKSLISTFKFHVMPYPATGSNLGVGLTGMRERILELGGNLQMVAESPGLSVRATIPFGQEHIEKARPFHSPDENGSAA